MGVPPSILTPPNPILLVNTVDLPHNPELSRTGTVVTSLHMTDIVYFARAIDRRPWDSRDEKSGDWQSSEAVIARDLSRNENDRACALW